MDRYQWVRRGDGKDYDYSMDHCFVKLASQDTNGELSMVEDTLKPGFQLGRHHHKKMTEVFYMLDGEIDFTFDDQTVRLTAGDTLIVPPNVWHSAESINGGRMLTIFKDGRFDEYLERLSQMTAEESHDKQRINAINEEFDHYID